MSNKMLVIIDMVNGFTKMGELADSKILSIVPSIKDKIIDALRERTTVIVNFRDSHSINDQEFLEYPIHCLEYSIESKLIRELEIFEDVMIDIPKNTTNGFKTDKFKSIISCRLFDEIIVTGCCTDICVENFVTSLNKFLVKNRFNTTIIVDANSVATFDSPNHIAAIENTSALIRMGRLEKVKVLNFENMMEK